MASNGPTKWFIAATTTLGTFMEVHRQASLSSFVDVFWFPMLAFAVSLPFIALLRSGMSDSPPLMFH